MIALTEQERLTLVMVGLLALAGLGVLLWQRQGPPLTVRATPTPVESTRWDAALDRARRVDVNTADEAELERLPEVGPTLARKIVEYRNAHGPFRTREAFALVPGIGPNTSRELDAYITLEGGQ